ncbi:Endoribonuclease L-PSP/chorismate mutase-like protein [Microdochium trichocladiopsis]|uniref:Endoribonuclease L-PSP/chorismate mutase-like protein n=1 Tax=Microdochium trichocladiopsis TaxID=1682393 RepID=A0A9P8XUW6_9PEZI|nr:Endoribonuclease L-PSP/chorismate mutase-like protein [Microdochium trichocladiopsis]KAH7014247.1 Endoribonuclease L-PSP/chorismate mutase-like protein [Microdochium trichocladiopsis]
MPPFTTVTTTKAPKALPQFSQAVKYNGTVFTSGNIGFIPETFTMVEGGIKEQTRQTLKNLSAVLEEAGSSFDNVYKANIFITNMENFAAMNEAWDEFFTGRDKPCRTCVAVFQLPMGALVEIECSAALN